MRSAELVGVAQTIACCGEIGGIGHRCENQEAPSESQTIHINQIVPGQTLRELGIQTKKVTMTLKSGEVYSVDLVINAFEDKAEAPVILVPTDVLRGPTYRN
jgi:hypothetical protein